MKPIFILFFVTAPLFAIAQTNNSTSKSISKTDSSNIDIKEEKFVPVNLWFVMLMKGPNRTQDSLTAAQIHKGHMENISKMAKSGKLITAGPFLEDNEWRGIFIIKAATKEEAESMVKEDLAIVAGRLSYKLLPWMTGQNCLYK